MGASIKALLYAFIFTVSLGMFGMYVLYFQDVKTVYSESYKDYMYYGAKQSELRLNGIDLKNFNQMYADNCSVSNLACSEDNFELLERNIIKYVSLDATQPSDIKYELYVNDQTGEVFVHIISGSVDSTIKIVEGN